MVCGNEEKQSWKTRGKGLLFSLRDWLDPLRKTPEAISRRGRSKIYFMEVFANESKGKEM